MTNHLFADTKNHQRVLITGGCGFVGINLVAYLLDHTNWNIVVLDDLSVGSEENLQKVTKGHESRVCFVHGDTRDQGATSKAMQGVSIVIHLAAESGIPPSLKDPVRNKEINVDGTLQVLEMARQQKVGRFIFASSAAPLGEQIPPLHEGMVPQPLSPYGASKLAGEAYCSAYSGSFDLQTVVLRFSNIYGPWSRHKSSAAHQFVQKILKGEAVTIHGNGEQTRDLIYVEDICRALLLAATTDLKKPFSLFQLGTEEETSMIQLFEEIKKVLEEKGHTVLPPVFTEGRKGDVNRNYTSIKKAREELSFSPQVDLKEGLRRMISWYLA